jgi:hypothetical protein
MTGVHSLKRMPEHMNQRGTHKLCAAGQTASTEIRSAPPFDAGLPIGVWGEYIQGYGECQVKSQLVPEKFGLCCLYSSR